VVVHGDCAPPAEDQYDRLITMWARLDDGWYDHPKIVASGPYGMALHAWCISYCARHLTDGYLRKNVIPAWAKPQGVKALLEVGLMEEVPGGYAVHDFLDWNPSRQQVLEERAQAKIRMARFRERENVVQAARQQLNEQRRNGMGDA
jgi:hypothetical protein